MTYYINPIWFYLMDISADVKAFLYSGGALMVIIAIIVFLCYAVDYPHTGITEKNIRVNKMLKKVICVGCIIIFIGLLVPSKEACIEMMVASQVTHENANATKEEIYELIDYIIDKVQGEEAEE